MAEKLRAVFLPLPALALALAAAFALLNRTVVPDLLPLDEDVAAIWLPLAAALVLVGLLISPRLHLLALNEKRNIPALYLLVALLAVAGPAILAQKYVQATRGATVTVADAAAIAPGARYYVVRSLCVDKARAVAHTRVAVSGDHDEYLDVDLYAAVPLCGSPAWLGLIYHTRIDHKLADAKQDALYRDFLKDSQRSLDGTDPAAWRTLERVGVNADLRGFQKALKENHVAAPASMFLAPHTEPLAPRGENFLGGAVIVFAAGTLVWLAMVLVAPLVPPAERKPSPPGWAAALVVPHRESFGLPILLDINLLVYLAMVLSGLGFMDFELDDLIAWGASSAALDHDIGVVRMITATFVHAGFFHILGNLYALLIAALFLTPVARNTRLIACYLVCGLGGSLMSVTVHPQIVSVGASGAIFGLFGVLLTLIALRDAKMVPLTRVVLVNVGIFLVFNLVYGAMTPDVDNFAHIGGFLAGIPCGLVLYVLDRREKDYGEVPPPRPEARDA
jgi:rhomboid protease GluP